VLNFIAGVVLAVWSGNFVATLAVDGYDGSAINGVFTVIMGAILAIKGKQGGQAADEDEAKPEETRSHE
jgi:hypothetical protein